MGMLEALERRRSFYALGKALPVPQNAVSELVKRATTLVPDAFNSRSARVAILFGKKHEAFWDGAYEVFGGKVARAKTDGFKAAAGTLLYFYDEAVVKTLQEKFPRYAENFPLWAREANAMLQISIWTALRELEIGANLQHYNPVVDELARRLTGFPSSYKLLAQMPFGKIEAEARAKEGENIDLRVKVFE